LGYRQVQGVDLYVPAPIHFANGVEVHKGTIHDMPAGWDVIMLHHAFEHMPDPQAVLQAVAQRLTPGGLCLIRIPVVPSLAWERYGVDWVQWDAPRHFFLHSVQSMALLAERAGLRVAGHFCDSTPFQFVGSELYRRDIALAKAGPQARFTPEEMDAFRAATARANAAGHGDQVAFYLHRGV
jgi:SAM-dependent methyltransferase